MFSDQMSYYELVAALSSRVQQKSNLTKYELSCVKNSIEKQFLKDMLILYPLPRSFEALILQQNEKLSFDVHDKLYQTPRMAIKKYLEKEFPPQNSPFLIERLEIFVQETISDPMVQYELELAEKARYAERLDLYQKGERFFIRPLVSFGAICEDFFKYLEHLRYYHTTTTYAWGVLESLLQRIAALSELSQQEEARLALILALDDARTAYHAHSNRSFLEPCYTCMKGLEEMLLGHHQRVFLNSYFLEPRQEFLSGLFEPFVQSYVNPDLSRTYSPLLYNIYLKAAGISVREQKQQIYCLKDDAHVSALRESYLTQFDSAPQKVLRERDFNNIIALLKSQVLMVSGQQSPIIAFLRSHHALTINKKKNVVLEFPAQQRSEEAILSNMLKSGFFIDMAHLKTVLALTDPHASLATMQQSAVLQTMPDNKPTQTRRKTIQRSYDQYLEERGFFYAFYHRDIKELPLYPSPLFYAAGDESSLVCSQDALIEHWAQYGKMLPDSFDAHFITYLVQIGYVRALSVLFAKKAIEARGSDLMEATLKGHIRVAELLIAHGAPLNSCNQEGFSPLVRAAADNNVPMVELFLRHGAQLFTSTRTAMIEAAAEGHVDVMNVLISYGSFVDEVRWGKTPLKAAIDAGAVHAVQLLLDSGARLDDVIMRYALEAGHSTVICCLVNAGGVIPMSCFYQLSWRTLWGLWQLAGNESKDQRDDKGRTPLIRAVLDDSLHELRQLLKQGACPNKRCLESRTALDYAVVAGNAEAVKELLCYPMAPRTQIVALNLAIKKKEYNIASLLYHTPIAPLIAQRYPAIQRWYEDYIKRTTSLDHLLDTKSPIVSFSNPAAPASCRAQLLL